MQKQQRHNIFETGLGITHALSSTLTDENLSTLQRNNSGKIFSSGGKFGRNTKIYKSCQDKINYLVTYLYIANSYTNAKTNSELISNNIMNMRKSEAFRNLCSVIFKYGKAILVIEENKNANPFGYIKGKPNSSVDEILSSKEHIANFIFNPQFELHINDRSY